ncbi:hypothetical protein CPC08DRAFT_814324 [Agrocybe pediades]|nr:hypothetical protein CPC08DRAFT_814324 [Agrocybe pediades]
MAGAFSGHLIDAHTSMANSSFNSPIATHGAMSFNPMMHGTPYPQQSFSLFSQPFFNPNESISEETAKKIATLQVKLNQKLGPEYISQRPGPGGGPKLTYVEGWKIINLANEVFGFNGWSSNIVSLTTDFADYVEETRRYNVGVTAIMRVTLKDGVYHEDIGYGMLENSKSKGAALDKCKKEAVTDGLKRALRNFGNVMGNCLYDKSYAQEVVKVKFEPTKFNKDDLHRRPEFQDAKPNITVATSSSTAGPSNYNSSRPSMPSHNAVSTPTRPQHNQPRTMSSIPTHMRSEINAASIGSSTANNHLQDNNKGKTPMHPHPPNGLNTPITTPLHQQPQQIRRPTANAEASSSTTTDQATTRPPVKPERSEEDESFGFGSEDDAFLAMADLGPGILNAHDADMGRPIEADTDIGRPIDHEEGLLVNETMDDHDHVFAKHPADKSAMKPVLSGSRSDPTAAKTRQEIMEAALRGEPVEDASTKITANRAMQPPSILKPSSTSSSSLTNVTRPSAAPQQLNPAMRPTSFAQQQHQRYLQNRQKQDQNVNVDQQNQNGTTAEGPRRAPTPSVGGFNFPAGMNPLSRDNSSIPPAIGIKRPAETLQNSSNYRGGRAGMGLQQATASLNQGAAGRQVLGSLEVGNTGDVKRPRLS